MLRNKLAIFIIVLCGFGCRQSVQQRVYVDFEAVLASYKASPLPSRPVPKPPSGLPEQTVSIPAVAPRTVVVEGTSTAATGALLETNRKLAVEELTRLLSRRYVREVAREGARRILELDPIRKASFEAAQAAVTVEFERYAEKRSPLVARLTSIVGFPDPNPNSVPAPESSPPFAVKRLQEASAIRKDMAELDAQYVATITGLLAKVETKYNVDVETLQKQLDQDRQAAMRRAEAEAVAEAAKTYKDLRPILMGPTQVDLPGGSEQSLLLPPVPAPMAAPEVRERTLNANQRRSILEAQLQIWLKLNGYDLSKTATGVEDMTAEFVKWRQERKL
jgi:hypothetical protein